MKNFIKNILGVTLLEIMLVLAIAAMVIVMSVRYYQSANASQQTNTVLSQITSIVAAADSLAQPTGSYATSVTTAKVQAILPANSMTTPWGTAITISAPAASSYTINIPSMPADVCPLVTGKLGTNNHFTVITACAASGPTTVTTTYLANP